MIWVAGVDQNGAGKTTSIAKLGQYLKGQGKSVMVAACDTFRAAAVGLERVMPRRGKQIRRSDYNSEAYWLRHAEVMGLGCWSSAGT